MGPVSVFQIAKKKKIHVYIYTNISTHPYKTMSGDRVRLATLVPSREKKEVAGGHGWKGNCPLCILLHLLNFEPWASIIYSKDKLIF